MIKSSSTKVLQFYPNQSETTYMISKVTKTLPLSWRHGNVTTFCLSFTIRSMSFPLEVRRRACIYLPVVAIQIHFQNSVIGQSDLSASPRLVWTFPNCPLHSGTGYGEFPSACTCKIVRTGDNQCFISASEQHILHIICSIKLYHAAICTKQGPKAGTRENTSV